MKNSSPTPQLAKMYMKIIQVPWYRPHKARRLMQEYEKMAREYRIKRKDVESYIRHIHPEFYQELQLQKDNENH